MVNKIITHIITKRISDAITLRRQQAGFCPNKSCIDHVNTLRIIVEQSVEWRSPLYLIFIDFEKAFDTLNHNVIWKSLQCKGVPQKLIQLIKSMYVSASCRIQHEGKLSRKINVGTGVRQGCVMSPLLFNIVLDIVMSHAMSGNRGIGWGLLNRLNDLEYADDICLFSHRYSDMNMQLQRLTELAKNAGLKINIGKTKVMRINTENLNIFTIDNVPLEEVNSFCYLGAVITTSGGSGADIANRIKKATQAYGQLKKIWNSSTLSRRVKLNIFNSNVRSTLLYGCETWNAAPRDMHALQVFINKCLRRILRVFWPQYISNNRLWHQTNQSPINIEIQRRKWNWIGHTIRKPVTDIARTAIEWNPQGSRRRGRPAHTWRRQIETEVSNMQTSWNEVKNIAMNRSRWKDFVEALCSL